MRVQASWIVQGTFDGDKNPTLRLRSKDEISWNPETGQLNYRSHHHPNLHGPLHLLLHPQDVGHDIRAVTQFKDRDAVLAMVITMGSVKSFQLDEKTDERTQAVTWFFVHHQRS